MLLRHGQQLLKRLGQRGQLGFLRPPDRRMRIAVEQRIEQSGDCLALLAQHQQPLEHIRDFRLRFGDIAPDTDAPAANPVSAEAADTQTTTPRENRYLFIMVDFDPQSARSPGRAAEGEQKAQLLRARFAPWYYVIAADSFADIQVKRRDLVKRRTSAAAASR